MKGDWNCSQGVTTDSLAEDMEGIEDAEPLDSVQLTTNEFVELYIVATDPNKRVCGFRGKYYVATHWTVRWE